MGDATVPELAADITQALSTLSGLDGEHALLKFQLAWPHYATHKTGLTTEFNEMFPGPDPLRQFLRKIKAAIPN